MPRSPGFLWKPMRGTFYKPLLNSKASRRSASSTWRRSISAAREGSIWIFRHEGPNGPELTSTHNSVGRKTVINLGQKSESSMASCIAPLSGLVRAFALRKVVYRQVSTSNVPHPENDHLTIMNRKDDSMSRPAAHSKMQLTQTCRQKISFGRKWTAVR